MLGRHAEARAPPAQAAGMQPKRREYRVYRDVPRARGGGDTPRTRRPDAPEGGVVDLRRIATTIDQPSALGGTPNASLDSRRASLA